MRPFGDPLKTRDLLKQSSPIYSGKTEVSPSYSHPRPFPNRDILLVNDDSLVNYDTGVEENIDLLPNYIVSGRGGFICGKSLYGVLAGADRELSEATLEWRMKI